MHPPQRYRGDSPPGDTGVADCCTGRDCGSEGACIRFIPTGTSMRMESDTDQLFWLHDGLAAVGRRDPDGIERIADIVGPGEIVGQALPGGTQRETTTITTLRPSLVCMCPMERLVSCDKQALRLLRGLCNRLDRLESLLDVRG